MNRLFFLFPMLCLIFFVSIPLIAKANALLMVDSDDSEEHLHTILLLLEKCNQPFIAVAIESSAELNQEQQSLIQSIQGNGKAHCYLTAKAMLQEELKIESLDVTYLTLGNLTQIAQALMQEPYLKKRIAKMVVLGGAMNLDLIVDELDSRRAVFRDAPSAAFIMRCDLPLTLVPFDLFTRLQCKESCSWSFLTALVALHPDLALTNPLKIEVTLNAGERHGHTKIRATGRLVNVCLEVNYAQLELLLKSYGVKALNASSA